MLRFRRATAVFLPILLAFTVLLPVSAATATDALRDTADYVKKNTPVPGFRDDWKVMVLCNLLGNAGMI